MRRTLLSSIPGAAVTSIRVAGALHEFTTLEGVKEIAFGWLGIIPETWYDMEFDDFQLMVKGFFAKRKRDELNFANIGFIIDALAVS